MSTREKIIGLTSKLPEIILDEVLDFILFVSEKCLSDEEYLNSVPGMRELILSAAAEPISEGMPADEVFK